MSFLRSISSSIIIIIVFFIAWLGCRCFQCYPHKFTITPLSSYGMNESFFVDLIFHCRVPLFDWLVCKKARKKVFVVILESLLFFQYGHSNIINFRSSMIIYLRYHFDQQKKKSPEKVMMIVFIVLFCQHRFSPFVFSITKKPR